LQQKLLGGGGTLDAEKLPRTDAITISLFLKLIEIIRSHNHLVYSKGMSFACLLLLKTNVEGKSEC
jgi:hypothetical protein